MDQNEFQYACLAYIKEYKSVNKKEYTSKPTDISDGEECIKYFIKGKASSTKKSIKFTYLTRKYFYKKEVLTFKETTKTFSVKLTQDELDSLMASDKDYISSNYLIIIAYISNFELTNESYIKELAGYLTEEAIKDAKSKKKIKEVDPRIGKKVLVKKLTFYKEGFLTKNSEGIIKSIKGDTFVIAFKQYGSKHLVDAELKENQFIYIQDSKEN